MKRAIFSLLLIMANSAPARAAEVPKLVVLTSPEPQPSPVDNLRFGVAQFSTPAIASLFGGGQAVALGLDYSLGNGLAVGLDTYNLFKNYGDQANYFLTIDPVHLRYRLGLPGGVPGIWQPYATAGAGLSLMGLFGGPAGLPQAGVGPSASLGLGAQLGGGLALSLDLNAGQVAQIPYYGWQLRLGTPIHDLGDLTRLFPAPAQARAQQPAQAAAPAESSGVVRRVSGDRLEIAFTHPAAQRRGDDVVVYYQDWATIKVARARLLSLAPDGRAVAQVVSATETIKPGYHVRAW